MLPKKAAIITNEVTELLPMITIDFHCLASQSTEGASFHTVVDSVFDFSGMHLLCHFTCFVINFSFLYRKIS